MKEIKELPSCILELNGFIQCEFYQDNLYLIEYYDWYDDNISHRLFILDNDNKNIVGSAEIIFENNELSDFSIYEEYRNNGYGSRLLTFAINNLKINKLFVEKENIDAQRFYIRNGFHIVKDDNHLFLMVLK